MSMEGVWMTWITMGVVIPEDFTDWWIRELNLIAVLPASDLVSIIDVERLLDVNHEPALTVDRTFDRQRPTIRNIDYETVSGNERCKAVHALVMDGEVVLEIVPVVRITAPR